MACIERKISDTLGQAVREYPVVTVTGPRQSGKTTLVRHQFPDYAYVNLESPDDRLLATEDPRSFLKRYAPPVVFDEIQRAPQLLSYIQVEVDEHPQETGRYILTGSQQMDLRAAVSQSLAGRTALLRLLPFSIAELRDAGIILDRDEYLYRGFMPRLYEADLQVTPLYRNYFQTYIERDVRQFAAIRNSVAFETFLKLLAGRVGQLTSMSDLANSTGVSSTTLAEWLAILEASFIVFRLPPCYRNFGKRLIKSPKLYFTEPGLVAYLLGIREAGQIATHPLLGGMFENLVVAEALKAGLNRGEEPGLYFFRDNNGLEADLVIESAAGLTPVEIKASRTFSPDFCKAFPRLQKIDEAFRPGLVIYAGELETEFKGAHVINFTNFKNMGKNIMRTS
jgi:predicted AAA+ superfamily ATPase